MKNLTESANFIKSRIKLEPKLGIVLGSGLGGLADCLTDAVDISYKDIANFPISTVEGHEGKLAVGNLDGTPVLAMKGRFHYYEGYNFNQVAIPIRVMKLLGIQTLIVTNAAGGINKNFTAGDLMLITDHIKFFSDSPLRGKNMEQFGPRFNDMSEAYSRQLRAIAEQTAKSLDITLQQGVYAFMPGPSYETPAEIRMLSILGADAVGMSTVPEVITAVHSGIKVLGISCITNMAAGVLDQPLNHAEVMETADKVKEKFSRLVRNIIKSCSVQF